MRGLKEKIMECHYQYIKLPGEEKRYFCMQQNPLILAWLLFFKKNTLRPMTIQNGSNKWSRRWIKEEIRNYYSFYRKNFRKLIRFMKYKLHFRNMDSFVELPFYGQVSVLVNKGYKILDLRRGVAIKVYRNDVDLQTVTNELDCLKKGNLFKFGTSITRWNIEERWYEEDYIGGSLDRSDEPRNSSALLDKFYKDVVPCLERLIFYQSPLAKHSVGYANKIKSDVMSGKLWREGLDANKRHKIQKFIDAMVRQVECEGNQPILLVLTHGDFCPANMLNTRRGLRLIDWESTTYRSVLFDFYSYFFFRPLHQKHPLEKSCAEINEALRFVLSKLDVQAPAVSESLKAHEKIYRWLFYIERIYMLIEREKYDRKLNILDEMVTYTEVFNSYEAF